MARYRIDFDRNACAGYANCASVSPDFWQLQQDGKSSVKNGLKAGNDFETLEIGEEDLASNQAAAFSCPVKAIHITNLDSGEKII